MADYSEEQQSVFDDISAAGGVITFVRPPAEGTSQPSDPDAPWEGNDDDPENVDHVALILPLKAADKNDPDANHKALIPGKGLAFSVLRDQEFTDEAGNKYVVKFITRLAPNPLQIILYNCEVALWPAT